MSKLTEDPRKELEELEELLNRIPKQYDDPPTNRGPHKLQFKHYKLIRTKNTKENQVVAQPN